MNILLATVFDYPHAGGLSTHVTTLKAGLEARGHVVDVVSISDVPKAQQYLFAKGPSFGLNKMKKGRGILWSRQARKNLLKAVILRKAKERQYDIVNAQDVFATFASLEAGLPTVSTVHGYMAFEAVSAGSVPQGSEEEAFLKKKEIEAFQTTTEIITVDQRIKEYVKKQANVDGTAIRNFIDIHAFQPETEKRQEFRTKHGVSEDAFVYFIPRRLTKKNGVIYPIKSLPAVLKSHPNVQLIYAGTGESLSEMKAEIEREGLANSVRLLGAIPHHEMKEFYALADGVLVPSIHSAGVEEATSISALEAMGSGIPLIACAVGGLKEIVDHKQDGILVEEKNIPQLSEAMIQLVEHPEEGQRMATAARLKIEKQYSHLTAAEKYEAIYEKAIRHKKSSTSV
ncbi:glycosyltransferase family 4 protein [Bacillus fonticola]|uniref:glycosyltransferase family 4 protein n=1 Tax=Bacillus fonticola TaxID=2728853 RepID=UPI0014762E9D|nr:glycosyltransferase family 4 protein [Bacillus fonticola]